MNSISVTWNGHSCFTIEKDGFSIIFDPYAPDSVPGLAPLSLTADLVLCSHEHSDHGFKEAVTLRQHSKENPFSITKIDTWHDPEHGALRGPDRIHILESDGLKIVHMGDIGCPLTREQKDLLKHPDIIMIPIGGYYTIDAIQAKEMTDSLEPRVIIPMHYRSDTFGYPVIGRLEEFTSLCRNVTEHDSSTMILTPETKPQTAVLKPVSIL